MIETCGSKSDSKALQTTSHPLPKKTNGYDHKTTRKNTTTQKTLTTTKHKPCSSVTFCVCVCLFACCLDFLARRRSGFVLCFVCVFWWWVLFVCLFVLFVVGLLTVCAHWCPLTLTSLTHSRQHHKIAQQQPHRVGALLLSHRGLSSTRVSPGKTPTVHPCSVR